MSRRTLTLASLLAALLCASVARGAPAPPQQDPEQERVEETVTVTASRIPLRLADVPAAVEVIDGASLLRRPALGLDEALRWLPEASLFRRAPARGAHPTSQGLNLRGVAPSGTSRALVLADGVPITDPFGGWVYWNRVPGLAVDRIEVALGGGSAPFGNQALAGVVQIVTRPPTPGFRLHLRALAGEDATRRIGATASGSVGGIPTLIAVEAFDTDGYFDVAPAARGRVDRPVANRYFSGRLRLRLGAQGEGIVEGLAENRDNGTELQTNRSRAGGASFRTRGALGDDRWQASAFGRWQAFESRFSAVSDDRDDEIPVLEQRVPSTELGGSFVATLTPGPLEVLSVGADVRRVDGHSRERVVLAGFRRQPGGRQLLAGAFATAEATAGDWRLTVSGRLDGWRNAPDQEDESTRSAAFVSPRLGILWQPDDSWGVRAAAYRSFRAPTLNELYRQFRVGDIVTRENPSLEEERLTGAELGLHWQADAGAAGELRVAATGYLNDLDDAVVNATLGQDAGLVLRQRRNAGAARIAGLELDLRLRRGRWHLDAALAAIDAEIREAAGLMEAAAGNRLPQVPTHRLRASVGYRAAAWQALLAVHATGEQFEDELGRRRLAPGTTVDASLDWQVSEVLSLGVRAQNLLDERLQVGRVPLLTLGPPRSVSALLDLRLSGP